jgi:hypothetical protein
MNESADTCQGPGGRLDGHLPDGWSGGQDGVGRQCDR